MNLSSAVDTPEGRGSGRTPASDPLDEKPWWQITRKNTIRPLPAREHADTTPTRYKVLCLPRAKRILC